MHYIICITSWKQSLTIQPFLNSEQFKNLFKPKRYGISPKWQERSWNYKLLIKKINFVQNKYHLAAMIYLSFSRHWSAIFWRLIYLAIFFQVQRQGHVKFKVELVQPQVSLLSYTSVLLKTLHSNIFYFMYKYLKVLIKK